MDKFRNGTVGGVWEDRFLTLCVAAYSEQYAAIMCGWSQLKGTGGRVSVKGQLH